MLIRYRTIIVFVLGTGRESYRFLTGEAESGIAHPWFRIEKIRELETVFLLTVLLEVSHHLLELFLRDFSSRVPLLQYLRWPSPVVSRPAIAPPSPPPPPPPTQDEEEEEEEEKKEEKEKEEDEGEEKEEGGADGRRG